MIDWLIEMWESLWSSDEPAERGMGYLEPNG